MPYIDSWRKHHPSWKMLMWTEENLPRDLVRAEALDRLRVPAERSDILRLEVLHRMGGVYVDTDFECRQSLDPHIGDVDFFVAHLKPGRANNALIGSIAQHPILARALRELTPREFHGYDKWATGPLFLDRLLKDYPNAFAFEPALCYPSDPAQEAKAIAIHHAARSWKDADGFRKATLIAEKRLRDAQLELHALRRKHERSVAKLAALERERRAESATRARLTALAERFRRDR